MGNGMAAPPATVQHQQPFGRSSPRRPCDEREVTACVAALVSLLAIVGRFPLRGEDGVSEGWCLGNSVGSTVPVSDVFGRVHALGFILRDLHQSADQCQALVEDLEPASATGRRIRGVRRGQSEASIPRAAAGVSASDGVLRNHIGSSFFGSSQTPSCQIFQSASG